jgi:hypothetical protein
MAAVLVPFLHCCSPTNGPGGKVNDGLPVYCARPPCKDTLSGWIPIGPDQPGTPYDGRHFVEVKALGRSLFARNSNGDIYFRPEGDAWKKLALGEKAAPLEAMAVEGTEMYLLTASGKIFGLDARGTLSFREKLPDSMICQLPGTTECHAMQLFRYQGSFFIEAGQAYTDSTFPIFRDSLFNYHLLVGRNGSWRRMRWQQGFRPKLNLSFRNFWVHGDSILGASYEDGIWVYDGSRWDSIANPTIPQYADSNGVRVPAGTLPVQKWGGVAVYQGSIYAAPWTGGLYRLEDSALKKITLKTTTNTGEVIEHEGLFNYGLDTLCGNLINVHGIERWRPGALGWLRVVDTALSYAVHGYYYPVASTFSMVRIGDSVFAAYQDPIPTERDSLPGGIAMLNLRDTPWCEEAWNRRSEGKQAPR